MEKMVEKYQDQKLLNSLDRIARAIEQTNNTLEYLLPSPFTSARYQSNDQKPRGEETLKVRGDREAYLEELKEKKKGMDNPFE